jgi:hypothetical protein
MSGTLGKALIPPGSSGKIYSNSSGNPASITIHTQVVSPTENSKISIKTSTTDACLQCTTVLDTANVTANVTGQVVDNDSGTHYCGFTLTQVIDVDDHSSSFCDKVDTATYTKLPSGGVCSAIWCGLTSGMYPAADEHFGSSTQCCVKHGGYAHSVMGMNHRNYPSFTANNKETDFLVTDCCLGARNSQSQGGLVINYSLSESSPCCCLNLCDSTYCKQRLYHCGYECFSSCYPCCFVRLIDAQQLGAQDIWSDSNPIFFVNNICQGGSCQQIYANSLNSKGTGQRQDASGTRCSTNYAWGEDYRNMWNECCNCRGCCCCNCWQQVTHNSHKYWMAGCNVAFNPAMGIGCNRTEVIVYPGPGECDLCLNSAVMGQMSRYNARDQCPNSCCVYAPVIQCLSSPEIKWLWYNPYTNCNYFEVMTDDNATSNSGIYSLNPSYSPNGDNCHMGGCYVSCNWHCYTLAEWIDFGFIKCVSGTPSAWSEKTSKFETSSNPRLIRPCCWAIWKQCFTWNSIPAEGGWNGCMTQYRSKDLISWTKVEDFVSHSTESGSGKAVCTTTLKNDGADFTRDQNFYFNSSNCVDDSGTLEYKADANRLERTGIVISNGENVYVNNEGSSDLSAIAWGYDE